MTSARTVGLISGLKYLVHSEVMYFFFGDNNKNLLRGCKKRSYKNCVIYA
jgi:hypothetical protein